METNRTLRNILETTCIVQARAQLTPTLTHVVTYELVTSGADRRRDVIFCVWAHSSMMTQMQYVALVMQSCLGKICTIPLLNSVKWQ